MLRMVLSRRVLSLCAPLTGGLGAVRPDVGGMVTSVIILSLHPARPMRPDAQDGKYIFRYVVSALTGFG